MRLDHRSLIGLTSGAVLLGVGLLLAPFGGEAEAAKCEVPPTWSQNITDAKKRFVPVLTESPGLFIVIRAYCDEETGLE